MKHDDARKIEKHLNCQAGSEAEQSRPDSPEAWEKEQYACYYNYLFSLIQDNRLAFDKVAKRTGLKERRLEEVLSFRLKPGNKPGQLFGYSENQCFVCNARMNSLGSREPVCLRCLQLVEKACLEIEEDEALLSVPSSKPAASKAEAATIIGTSPPEPEEAPTTDNPALNSAEGILLSESPILFLSGEMVAIEHFQALQLELEAYIKHFGPLTIARQPKAASMPTKAVTAQSDSESTSTVTNTVSAPVEQPLAAAVNEAEQLLQILSVDDRELAAEATELSDLIRQIMPSNKAPLRHFGFQRPKSHKA